jgi:hypothetical protein
MGPEVDSMNRSQTQQAQVLGYLQLNLSQKKERQKLRLLQSSIHVSTGTAGKRKEEVPAHAALPSGAYSASHLLKLLHIHLGQDKNQHMTTAKPHQYQITDGTSTASVAGQP